MTRRAVLPALGVLVLLVAAPAPARASSAGGIAGVVLDGDRPVAEVAVSVAGSTPVSTDSTGAFRINDVPGGTAQLTFTLPVGGMVQSDEVVVADGKITSLTERVQPHGTLAGRILTNHGKPAAGAVVGLDDALRSTARTTTDARGDFRIDYVTPGRQAWVFVRARAGAAPTQWVPRITPRNNETPRVTFTAGQVTRIEERLLPLGTVTGTFSGPPGTEVTLDGPLFKDGTMSTTHTAADGSFSLLAFAGQHGLYYDWSDAAPPQTDTETGQRFQYAEQALSREDQTWFTVPEDRVLRHDETMMPRGVLSGRLLNYDGHRLPWSGWVEIIDHRGLGQSFANLQPDGSWSVTDIAAGAYQVYYNVNYRRQFDDRFYTVHPGRTTTVPTTRLIQAGEIAVKAAQQDGTPVTGFCAVLYNEAMVEYHHFCAGNQSDTATGEGVSPGTYQVAIDPKDYRWTATATAVSGKLTTVTVLVEASETTE